MKKLLLGLAALPFLAGVAMAGQPTPLSDAQMDKMSAGLRYTDFVPNGPFGVPTPVLPTPTGRIDFNVPTFDGMPGFPTVTFR